MRQAGRYLPEYREVRGDRDILETIRIPDLQRLREAYWAPESDVLFTEKVVGVGWSVNVPVAMRKLVTDIEETLIRSSRTFGIPAERNEAQRGIWVRGRKLGSIGMAVHNLVTYHGFAHNVNTDLSYFERIRPCGNEGRVMTSMEKEFGHPVDMAAFTYDPTATPAVRSSSASSDSSPSSGSDAMQNARWRALAGSVAPPWGGANRGVSARRPLRLLCIHPQSRTRARRDVRPQ